MRVGRLLFAGILAGFIAVPPAAHAQGPRPMTFVDVIDMPLLHDPQLSPDGKRIVFVMLRADWRVNRPIGHIYRINSDGTDHVQLTFGEGGEAGPRWSPDGMSIAFLARRDNDANNQIYLLALEGGEARRVTAHPTAPGSVRWAPDGRSLYFTATDAKTAEERERDRLQDDIYAFEETNFKQRHLWVATLDGRTTRLTDGDFSVGPFEVSRDGTTVVMSRAPSPLLEHSPQAEVWLMSVNGTDARRLTTNAIPERAPSLSPDNATVAFLAGANETFDGYYNDKMFLVSAGGGDARLLLPDVSYEVLDVTWAPDGKGLYFLANMGVHTELMHVDLESTRVRQLTSGEHTIGAWTYLESARQHVFTRNTALRASEVHTLSSDGGGEPRRVTRVFDYIDRQFALARQQRLAWKGQDGQQIEGLLFYPVEYVPGRRYPLIVITHGGPEDSDKFGLHSDVQVYAGKGYAVLKPNYRGSTGYGDAFLRDMVGGYFTQSHLDVMAGIDTVISMGLADPNRLVKMGASAGGHMTNKLITFTDRFKAASSFAGAANWISMYSQSDTRLRRDLWFGGTPYDADAPIDLYWSQSPLKDAAKVRTPTLFIVGENDLRVPLPQSVEMYRALKRHDVPTRLYVAPREGHGLGELRHRLFKFQVEMEWFERHVHHRPYVWEKAPGDEPKDSGKPVTTQP